MLQPKDTDWLYGYKNKTYIYMLSTRNPVYVSKRHRETERMEKYIPCKWEAKESWSSNPHIRQNRP